MVCERMPIKRHFEQLARRRRRRRRWMEKCVHDERYPATFARALCLASALLVVVLAPIIRAADVARGRLCRSSSNSMMHTFSMPARHTLLLLLLYCSRRLGTSKFELLPPWMVARSRTRENTVRSSWILLLLMLSLLAFGDQKRFVVRLTWRLLVGVSLVLWLVLRGAMKIECIDFTHTRFRQKKQKQQQSQRLNLSDLDLDLDLDRRRRRPSCCCVCCERLVHSKAEPVRGQRSQSENTKRRAEQNDGTSNVGSGLVADFGRRGCASGCACLTACLPACLCSCSLIQLFYTIQFELPSFGQLERKKSKMMIICACILPANCVSSGHPKSSKCCWLSCLASLCPPLWLLLLPFLRTAKRL